MTSKSRLIASAVVFAVLWGVSMLLWGFPHDAPGLIILGVAALVAGLLWYWLSGMWMRRQAAKS